MDPYCGVFFFGPEYRFTPKCPFSYTDLLNSDPRATLKKIDRFARELAADDGLYPRLGDVHY